jgi:hypothetical protein
MTTYAFDGQRRALAAVWSVGVGHRGADVAVLNAAVPTEQVERLCEALTGLSETMWDTYVRPASAVEDDEQEQWRRGEQRAGFAQVLESVKAPELPDEQGLLMVSHNPVIESAHALGRVLWAIGEPALSEAVLAEVHVDIEAVQAAERGDLTGRAVQAVGLDRVDASPVQVAAADQLFDAHPLGSPLLVRTVEPAAACVAAAHWLAAAADVAAEAAGIAPAGVFGYADDIEAVSVEVPTLVVTAIIDDDTSPREVVLDLLADAVAVRDGRILDPSTLAARVDEARARAAHFPAAQREEIMASLLERITPLDPARPARDLLEHLLDGISSCLLAYREHRIGDGAPEDDLDAGDGDNGDDLLGGISAKVVDEFTVAVRQHAHADRARLA